MNVNHDSIQQTYSRLYESVNSNCSDQNFLKMTTSWKDDLWKSYLDGVISPIKTDFNGKIVCDIGCKYGHLSPLLLNIGASKVINVDVEDEYVATGNRYIKQFYPDQLEYLQPENIAYLPIESDTVDIIIINEVISHINYMFLDLLLLECSRILKIGGVLFISDGNNIAHPGYKDKLFDLYEAWENGPDGAKTDRDVVIESFLNRRIKIIKERHPQLEEGKVKYLALNTSGLWGSYLEEVIDRYVNDGRLIERKYRRGICPVNPSKSGVLMERGFSPNQVMMILRDKGFESGVVKPEPQYSQYAGSIIGLVKYYVRLMQYNLKNKVKPGWEFSYSEGFQVKAVKRY